MQSMIYCPPPRARSVALNPTARLIRDAATLGVPLEEDGAARLLLLLEELAHWNQRFNLTAITAPEAMLTHHLLDSLSIHPDLHGQRIADVGTGAGFPGLPLAVVNPQRHFTLIDSSEKKVRFVANTARRMGLTNVEALHARSEQMKPATPFDTVVTRAFAPLPRLVQWVAPLCGPDTRVLAMKGRLPAEEIAALPPPWRLERSREIAVPGLEAARCVLVLRR
ncbi:MAG: 16S rRNA (guanine(527)-N(7))-methyltransferase RsmG [Proteobacteria bacterium]|nr:16S rRNA (guanine(527)-N(7))-methyltransferase RsmG [Pseudomonadota bacterium]